VLTGEHRDLATEDPRRHERLVVRQCSLWLRMTSTSIEHSSSPASGAGEPVHTLFQHRVRGLPTHGRW